MKRLLLLPAILALAALACGIGAPTPLVDIHFVETIAAATLTAAAPTQSPPTLVPLPTFTLIPSATSPSFPTLAPPSNYPPGRVQFPPGGTSVTITGTVAYPDRVEYILRAMKGQQMTVVITSSGGANFSVLGVADGQPLKRLENEDRSWTGRLPATQDYLIGVAVPGGSTDFTLVVTIVW